MSVNKKILGCYTEEASFCPTVAGQKHITILHYTLSSISYRFLGNRISEFVWSIPLFFGKHTFRHFQNLRAGGKERQPFRSNCHKIIPYL